MKPINIIILIVSIVIFLTLLFIILFKYYNERIKLLSKRLEDSELDFVEKLKNKYNILIRMINIIENRYKTNSKTFDEVKKIKIEDLASLQNENLFNKCYKEIIEIKEDNKKVREIKSFREVIDEYNSNELHLVSLRTFHNKYTLEYNNLIKKTPYNIVSSIKHYKVKPLLEGNTLDEEINDLEV